MSTERCPYDNLFDLWHAWFGGGWPDEEDIPALERHIRALADAQRAKPKHEARKPHPDTQIGRQ